MNKPFSSIIVVLTGLLVFSLACQQPPAKEKGNVDAGGTKTITYDDGRVYVGEVKAGEDGQDIPNGKGVMTWPKGDKYEGDWVDGKREGKGRFVSYEGDIYTGEFKNDMKSGKGKHAAVPDMVAFTGLHV